MASPTPPKTLTLDEAKAALHEVVEAFNLPENLEKMNQAKQQAGEDLSKIMMIVLPVALSIQQAVIKKYGFEPTTLGITHFAMAIRMHESDPYIAQSAKELKEKFMAKSLSAK